MSASQPAGGDDSAILPRAAPLPEPQLAAPAELDLLEAAVEQRPVASSLPPSEHPGVDIASGIGARLCFGMLLHHFTVGAWSVTLASYVKANSGNAGLGIFAAGFVGTVYAAGPLGGLISPFLTGVLADRFFSSEKLMAVCHLLAAGALWGAATAQSQAGLFFWIFAFYTLYLPASTLMSSMSFHWFARPERHFPVVRAFGTLGWVLAGIFVGLVWPLAFGESIETTTMPIRIAIVVELILVAYCLTLPSTPPAAAQPTGPGLASSAVGELVRRPPFLAVLVVAALAHTLPQFYYAYGNVFLNWSGIDYAAAKMTGGQIVEIGCIVLLPQILPRIGVKRAILLGLAIWTVRFFFLSLAADPDGAWAPIYRFLAVWTHGASFALVSISLQLETDRHAGRRLRATGQGLLVIAMQGFGYLLGAQMAGEIGRRVLAPELSSATTAEWGFFWQIPAWGMAAVLAASALLLPADEAEAPATAGIRKKG